jgi:hypothetical protein
MAAPAPEIMDGSEISEVTGELHLNTVYKITITEFRICKCFE